MVIYLKQDGAWTPTTRAYLKRNGVWNPATEVYFKDTTWKKANEWDKVPPPSPLLQLEVNADASDRQWVKVSVQLPGAHNTDCALIRVNAVGTSTTYPSAPTGAGYVSAPWQSFPNEPWSDYYYNGYKVGTTKDHDSTAEFVAKTYPNNRKATDDLKPGTYRFMAWSMDFDGNWSAGVPGFITVPDKGNPTLVNRTARFEPHTSGTWRGTGPAWTEGNAYVSNPTGSSYEVGAFYYGNLIPDVVGNVGTIVPKSAQIRITRLNDNGAPTANVYARPSEVSTPGGVRDDYWADPVKIGQVSKGQSVWLPLPLTWFNKTNGNKMRSIHLTPTDTTATGYGVYQGVNQVEGQWIYGSIQLNWQEGP